MTLTKAELVDFLFDKVGTNKRVARDMVEALFEEVSIQFKRHESVKLSDFGNFQSRDKAARPGRNPKICADTPTAARRVLTFHRCQKLKSMVVKSYHGILTRTI